MNKEVFDRNHILFDSNARTKEEAFQAIARVAYDAGFIDDEYAYFRGMCMREKEVTTGFQDGIAIPHAKGEACLKPGIFLVKFEHPIAWKSLDGSPVHVALGLTIPFGGETEHLQILSRLARKMVHEEFRNALTSSNDVDTLYQTIAEIEL